MLAQKLSRGRRDRSAWLAQLSATLEITNLIAGHYNRKLWSNNAGIQAQLVQAWNKAGNIVKGKLIVVVALFTLSI